MLFNIYTGFAFLKIEVRAIARSNNTAYTENIKNVYTYQKCIPGSFDINLYVLMINLVNQLFCTGKKVKSINLLQQFFKIMIIAKE